MLLFELTALACLGAILSTIPIGPMNLVLISFTVAQRHRQWWAMTAGIVVMDTTVAISTWALAHMTSTTSPAFLNHDHPYRDIASSMVLAAMLMASGGMTLYRSRPGAATAKAPPCEEKSLPERPPMATLCMAFASGALGTLLEPALPLFWGAWWLRFFHHPLPLPWTMGTLLGLGVLVGDMLVFGAYRLAARSMVNAMPKVFLPRLETIVGSILVLLATILCAHVFHKIYVEAFS